MPLRGAGVAVPRGGRRSLGLPVRGGKPLTRRGRGAAVGAVFLGELVVRVPRGGETVEIRAREVWSPPGS